MPTDNTGEKRTDPNDIPLKHPPKTGSITDGVPMEDLDKIIPPGKYAITDPKQNKIVREQLDKNKAAGEKVEPV